MLARRDHRGSGDGEVPKDETTRPFSVEWLRNKQNEEHPKGQKLLGRVGFCFAISHEAGKKVKRVLRWSGGSKRAMTACVEVEGKGRRDTHTGILD